MAKKIMILGASILQLPAIQKALDMGLEPIVVDMNPNAVGFIKGVHKEVISTIDVPRIVEAAKRHQVSGIMTLATDMPMRAVATVSEEMNLVGISYDTALKATNKALMRAALQDANVPIPKFYKVTNKGSYLKAVESFNLPFIVKPTDNSGSRGIFLVENIEDVYRAYEYALSFSRSGEVIVEEYMIGPEISVETLAMDGIVHVIQITDKVTTGAPHFVEMGHTQPTRLSDDVVKTIKKITIQANHAIGIKNGPSHTEIIITREGPKIVELGARLGGDCITSHLVPLSTGVDMVEACIRIALGEEPDINQKYRKGSAIRYFKQHVGVVKNIIGIEEVKKIPGIRAVEIVHGIGTRVMDVESSGSRMGFVIAQGESALDAETICEEALMNIDIEIE